MDLQLIPIWITSLAAVSTGVYAIWRNGRASKKQSDEFKADIRADIGAVKKQLNDPDNGLAAIKRSADGMILRCAETSTSIAAQVKTNTDEIGILRSLRRKKKLDNAENAE